MRTAADIMTTDVVTISPETEIIQAAKLLLDKGMNGVPVVDANGHLAGILCQSDLVRLQKKLPLPSVFTLLDGYVPLVSTAHMDEEVKRIAAVKVSEAMTSKVVTITPEATVDSIAALMVDKRLHTLPVLEAGRLVGIVGKKDILKTLLPH